MNRGGADVEAALVRVADVVLRMQDTADVQRQLLERIVEVRPGRAASGWEPG